MHPALLKLQPFDIAARLVHLARCQSRREQGLGDIDTSQITEQRPYEPARESLATLRSAACFGAVDIFAQTQMMLMTSHDS